MVQLSKQRPMSHPPKPLYPSFQNEELRIKDLQYCLFLIVFKFGVLIATFLFLKQIKRLAKMRIIHVGQQVHLKLSSGIYNRIVVA